ncbi:MAG TPA: c-type cytochrome [Patescibacteria group bacterium]|nr:c-type cytochrome [Patescibacteria group bacterium]
MTRRLLLTAFVLAALAGAALPGPSRADAPDLGSETQREAGKKLYLKDCVQCHGEKGDGAGYAAEHLRPAPRNFTSGKFKIRTTPNGALPTTSDLKNIIRRGMPYSSMPAWPLFSDEELTELAYYVKTFSADFASPEQQPKPVELPKAPAPGKDAATIGRKAYEDNGCLGCHGNQGRGDGNSAPTLKDDSGRPLRPADLTARWTFRGGATREDIFRTLSTGLNGTPMPSYFDAIPAEQRWQLTDYVASLSPEEPGYANLIIAKHVDDTVDLAGADALFEKAPVARLPIVGQIMEPVRSFHPPATSVLVQAVYDGQSIAVRVRWNDMSAQKSGKNGPALPVPPEEEKEPEPESATPAAGGGEGWGDQEAAPAAPAAPAAKGGDVWGEEPAAAAGPASEFSDAVAVQWPLQAPTGARKPYFLFGDTGNPVDLWFMDLAKPEPRQFVGKGSQDLAANDTGDVTAVAKYEEGQWTVTFRRSLAPTAGMAFAEGQFVPVAFSVWDGFSRERGSRRGLTAWYHLYFEPAVVVSPVVPMIKTAAGVLALEILAIALVRRRSGRKEPAAAGAAGVEHGARVS